MQYAFVTLALTAATMAMPTKREALLSSVDNVANVDAITSGLPVVSGLNLPVKRDVTSDATKSVTELLKNVGVQANVNDLNVKRGIVDNTLSGTVGNVKDTVNGVKVGVQARDLVNGLVGGGVGGTVNGVLDTVGGLNVAKRAIVDNTVGDVKDILHGVQVGAQVKRSVVDQVKDIVNDVNVGVETKRDIVNNLVDSLGLDQTIGDLDVIKRDLMAGTVSPLLNTVTGTVDGLGLNVKRDSGSVLGLGSGTVGSVTGNSDKSDETLNLGSGTAGDLTEGLNVAHTLGNVLKRQESGSVLGLGSGTVGSVVGNSDKSDETLNLGSGTAGGLTDGLNLNHVVGNILKRQESGSVLGLGSGTVGGVVGNSEKSDETLNLGSGLVGSLTEGLNANHVVENVVKRQSGDVLGLASGTVGGVVGQSGNSDETLNLGSGLVGSLTEGLNANHVVENVVKRQSGDVLGLASGTVGGVVGQSGNSDETLNLGSGAVGSLTDGLNVNKVVGNVVKRQEGYSGHQDAYSGAQEGHSGDVLGLASGTVGGVVGGHGDSSSVLDLKSGTVGELMAGLNLNHIVEGVVKRSIQELDVHDLIASLSDEQIKQLTASLPTSN